MRSFSFIKGEVKKPESIQKAGDRVKDAIDTAGGLTAGRIAESELAQRVEDQMVIVIAKN